MSTPKSRSWLWWGLFVVLTLILAVMATSYNVIIVRDYERMVEFARAISVKEPGIPWLTIVFGTLGSLAVLSGVIIFFLRLRREMQLNQLQSEFIAAVSHELKTPISTLALSSSLLRSGGLNPEESARLWNSHDEELQRLREQVNSLLEAARWQSSPNRIQLESLDLESWLENALVRWKVILGPEALLVRSGDPLPKRVQANPATLQLVTDNLLDNARKFAQSRPEISIRTGIFQSKQGAHWKVEFTDRGWGFEPKFSQKIFQRFFRAPHAAPYAIPGTGLGLYLASSAVKAMRMKLSAESPGVGKGATFTLSGREQVRSEEPL